MEIDRSFRASRAAVFAVACVGVSAAGHVWMSESSIPAWALFAAVLAAGGAGYALAGRQRGFAPIAGLMLVGELGLHLLFAVAQHAAAGSMSSPSSMSGMPGMAGMPAMPGMIMRHPVPAAAWLCGGETGAGGSAGRGLMAPMAWMSAHGSAGMIAVHAAAGLLAAWWLRRGEAAAFRLLRALAQFALPLLVLVWPGAPVAADLTARVPEDRGEPLIGRVLVHAVVRRGPPTPVFCW